MDNTEMDALRQAYKTAVDEWVNAIRAEEAIATAQPLHDRHGELGHRRLRRARRPGQSQNRPRQI